MTETATPTRFKVGDLVNLIGDEKAETYQIIEISDEKATIKQHYGVGWGHTDLDNLLPALITCW